MFPSFWYHVGSCSVRRLHSGCVIDTIRKLSKVLSPRPIPWDPTVIGLGEEHLGASIDEKHKYLIISWLHKCLKSQVHYRNVEAFRCSFFFPFINDVVSKGNAMLFLLYDSRVQNKLMEPNICGQFPKLSEIRISALCLSLKPTGSILMSLIGRNS